MTSSQNHKFNRPAPAPRADRHRSNGSNSGSGSGSKVGREHKPLNRLASLLLRKLFKHFSLTSSQLPVRFRFTAGWIKKFKMHKVMKIRIELFKTIQCTWKQHRHQYRSVVDSWDRPLWLYGLMRTVPMKKMIKRKWKVSAWLREPVKQWGWFWNWFWSRRWYFNWDGRSRLYE